MGLNFKVQGYESGRSAKLEVPKKLAMVRHVSSSEVDNRQSLAAKATVV